MEEPFRIAFVITDLHVGGSPRMLRDLVVGLKKLEDGREFAPEVISLMPLRAKEENVAGAMQAAGVPVHLLHLTSPRQVVRGVTRLVRVLNEIRPQVVCSILIHANALATAAMPFLKERPKFAQSLHTMQLEPAWHWVLQGILSPWADAVIAPAQPILDRLANFGNIQQKIMIPNGIDVDRFAFAKPFLPEKLPWPNGTRVVGYVGRFDRVKNLPLLLRAVATLREQGFSCDLAMVGYGPDEARLKRLATFLHIAPHVHFVGPTNAPERWYKCFSCHALPSTVEGFGLTLAEAIAAGIPVAAVRTKVTEYIVRHGTDGLLVDRADPLLLAQAIKAVIIERETARLGSVLPPSHPMSAQAYVQRRFSVERMVLRYAQFLKNF